jgi:hypothetical protein
MSHKVCRTGCVLTAVKADIANYRSTITLQTYLDDQFPEACNLLAMIAGDKTPVDVQLEEQQMRLPLMGTKDPADSVNPEEP